MPDNAHAPINRKDETEVGSTTACIGAREICTPRPVRQPAVVRVESGLSDSPQTAYSPTLRHFSAMMEKSIGVTPFESFLGPKAPSRTIDNFTFLANVQPAAPSSVTVAWSLGMQGGAESAFQPVRQSRPSSDADLLPSRRVLKRIVVPSHRPDGGLERSKAGTGTGTGAGAEARVGEVVPGLAQMQSQTKGEGQEQRAQHSSSNSNSKPGTGVTEKPCRKRAKEEPKDTDDSEENGKGLQCKHCAMMFTSGQALGGHMSRKHTGKSAEYNYKKDVRKKREFERMKLLLAKKLYFLSLHHDYDALSMTPEGKLQAKLLMNRSKIKRLKSRLTDEEVNNFMVAH
jgi:hypothetical protein